jgi:hypothetical protein
MHKSAMPQSLIYTIFNYRKPTFIRDDEILTKFPRAQVKVGLH